MNRYIIILQLSFFLNVILTSLLLTSYPVASVPYLCEPLEFVTIVDVTMYHPVPEQTDDTPDIVADGTWFDINTASELSWIAVSRDLHSRWGGPLQFNDIIYINAGKKTGFYYVKDTMNKRFTNRIDILESPGKSLYSYNNINLYKVKLNL